MKKNNIFRSFAALMTGCAMFMVSCGPDDPEVKVEPEFPASVEKTVSPGQTVTLTFDANLDWEVSVPESSITTFWIEDGAMDVAKVSGKAGNGITVTIGTSSTESFEERSCAVSMKMDGKSQQIAKVIIPGKDRSLKVYAVEIVDGEMQYTDDGEYSYSAVEAESIDLVWIGSDFRLPVKVDANYSWTVKTPSWAQVDVPEERVGEIALTVLGVPSEYPLADAEGKIQFMAGETLVKEYSISIPGCEDIFTYSMSMGLSELVFNYAGSIKTTAGFLETDVTASVMGTSGVKVFAVGQTEGKFNVEAELTWLDVNVDEYDASEGADVLQDRNVNITVDVNEGDDRNAVIFFLPPSAPEKGSELFTEDMSAVKEEYQKYAISVTQLSSDQEYVMMLSSPSEMAANGAVFNVAEDETLFSKFGQTKYAYDLVYVNQYARDYARMTFAHSATSVKVFDASGADKTSSDDFFLSVSLDADKTGGVIDMISESKAVGYVVFYGLNDNVLAVIRCTFDPDTNIGEVADIEFIGEYAPYAEMFGASLEHIVDGPLYDQYKEYQVPIYHLTYTMENLPMLISMPASVKSYMPNPWSLINNFRVNNMEYVNGAFERIDGGVCIYMYMPEGKTRIDGNIFFYSSAAPSNDSIEFVLVCTMDLTGSEE